MTSVHAWRRHRSMVVRSQRMRANRSCMPRLAAMSREMFVSDSVFIPGVTAAEVYEQISDPTQMSRWSPENTSAEVDGPGGSLSVGDVFVGGNKRGSVRWHTRCVVVAADPGERFAFDVIAWGLGSPRLKVKIARWEYTFVDGDGGTTVTETWRDARRKWPEFVANAFDKAATGGKTFAEFQKRNIARTLSALRDDLANV